jgi:hypothetical protein
VISLLSSVCLKTCVREGARVWLRDGWLCQSSARLPLIIGARLVGSGASSPSKRGSGKRGSKVNTRLLFTSFREILNKITVTGH